MSREGHGRARRPSRGDAVDVLVIGGGPAGAASAVWAARGGLSVMLVDRARFPRHKACAEYLSPEATRDLEDIGVRPRVEAAGARRLAGFRLVSDDGASVSGRFERIRPFTPFRPFGYALAREKLDAIVLEAAREAGALVREGVAFERPLVEDGMVAGAVLNGAEGRETVRARAVIGADGLNSRLARQLGLDRRGGPERLGLVAHLEGMRGCTDLGEMFASRGWYVGVAPLGDDIVNAAMVVPLQEAAGGRPQWWSGGRRQAAEGFLAKLRTVPELKRRLEGARVVRDVMIAGPFARRARRVVTDGALLVGDAAEFFDPFTGEGVFAALRGGRFAGETIAAALRHGPAVGKALASYKTLRRKAFLGKWVLERVVGLAATQPLLMRRFTHQLHDRAHVADLWVGAAGDSVPLRALLAPRHLLALVV